MGCGGSKEEKKEAAAAAATPNDKPQPIKKIRTNFSDIHYDEPASGRRETTYAPSEVPESRRPTEVPEEAPTGAPAPVKGADGMLSPGSPASPAASPAAVTEPRSSWLGRARAKKHGTPLSDEEYIKAFGMTRAEFAEKMKDKPGVGPKQDARWAGGKGDWAGGGGGDG